MKKIGYHFTSGKNWEQIQKTGFIPYKISHQGSELNDLFPQGVKGTWVWIHKLKNRSKIGTLFFQYGNKKEEKLVELEIRYERKNCLLFGDKVVQTLHSGTINDEWFYHQQEAAVILLGRIPPSQVSLVKKYDLNELLG